MNNRVTLIVVISILTLGILLFYGCADNNGNNHKPDKSYRLKMQLTENSSSLIPTLDEAIDTTSWIDVIRLNPDAIPAESVLIIIDSDSMKDLIYTSIDSARFELGELEFNPTDPIDFKMVAGKDSFFSTFPTPPTEEVMITRPEDEETLIAGESFEIRWMYSGDAPSVTTIMIVKPEIPQIDFQTDLPGTTKTYLVADTFTAGHANSHLIIFVVAHETTGLSEDYLDMFVDIRVSDLLHCFLGNDDTTTIYKVTVTGTGITPTISWIPDTTTADYMIVFETATMDSMWWIIGNFNSPVVYGTVPFGTMEFFEKQNLVEEISYSFIVHFANGQSDKVEYTP